MEEKVSIVITNYKKEKFLSSAIKSCFDQTYKNIEIIVIDDASSGLKLIKNLEKFNAKNIKAFTTSKNYGHYACCNFAMDMASGKYITFLGADDTIGKDHVKSLINFLKNKKLKAVCCTYNRVDLSGNIVGATKRLCEASILFERKKFLNEVGYFHMVRAGADTEYRMRAEKIYGKKRVGNTGLSTYRALYLLESLTNNKKTDRKSAGRIEYVKKFINNIKNNNVNNLIFNYKNNNLPFKLNNKNIIVKDFNINTFKRLI